MIFQQNMAGVYIITHPYKPNVFKVGCSTNIARRMTDPAYTTMFPDEELPKFCGWISVEGYKTPKEVRFLEQSIFQQLLHKRYANNRELFIGVTIEEAASCIINLKLVPQIHYEIPIDNGVKDSEVIDFSEITVKQFQVPILDKMKTYFDTNQREIQYSNSRMSQSSSLSTI